MYVTCKNFKNFTYIINNDIDRVNDLWSLDSEKDWALIQIAQVGPGWFQH